MNGDNAEIQSTGQPQENNTTNKLTRREFLQISSATTLGALLAACGIEPKSNPHQIEISKATEAASPENLKKLNELNSKCRESSLGIGIWNFDNNNKFLDADGGSGNALAIVEFLGQRILLVSTAGHVIDKITENSEVTFDRFQFPGEKNQLYRIDHNNFSAIKHPKAETGTDTDFGIIAVALQDKILPYGLVGIENIKSNNDFSTETSYSTLSFSIVNTDNQYRLSLPEPDIRLAKDNLSFKSDTPFKYTSGTYDVEQLNIALGGSSGGGVFENDTSKLAAIIVSCIDKSDGLHTQIIPIPENYQDLITKVIQNLSRHFPNQSENGIQENVIRASLGFSPNAKTETIT